MKVIPHDEFGIADRETALNDLDRANRKLALTRDALRACFEENGRLQRAIVASSELACGLADARARLDDVGTAALERQEEATNRRMGALRPKPSPKPSPIALIL